MEQIREFIREQSQKPLVVVIFGFVVGLILGWFVIGWGIWPVEWQDAAPSHLRADLKEDYLRMVIDSNVLHPDGDRAITRYEALQPGAEDVLKTIQEKPDMQVLNLPDFESTIGASTTVLDDVSGEESDVEDEDTSGNNNLTMLLVMLLVTLALGGVLAAYFFLYRPRRNLATIEEPFYAAREAQRVSQETPLTDFTAQGDLPPMSQFMTTYMLGDDLFEDSFSIDAPTGEYLGECGVGISESIGVGEPKKVTALEVWLFDRNNDIQTVTKVLMSEHAYSDKSLRSRLAPKGDHILMKIGSETKLETETLRVVARVVDMEYGTGPSPDNSYFQRVTLELAVWQRE